MKRRAAVALLARCTGSWSLRWQSVDPRSASLTEWDTALSLIAHPPWTIQESERPGV